MTLQKQFETAQKLRNNGQTKKAINLYQKIRNSSLKKDKRLTSECLHMMGVANYQDGNFNLAAKFLNESLKEFELIENEESQGFVLRDLGANERARKNFAKAKDYLKLSIAKLMKVKSYGHEGISRVKLARVYADLKDFANAYKEINKGIDLLEKSSEKFFLSSAYLDRAKIDVQKSLDILDSFSNEDEYKERRKEIKKILTNK